MLTEYKYKIEMIYTDSKTGIIKEISSDFIQYLLIDHNYEVNNMPVLFISVALDKSLIDHMILNVNSNLITLVLYKFDANQDSQLELECFRKNFTYFLPKNVNPRNDIDYTEKNQFETVGNTFESVSFGLLAVDHINNNKKSIEMNLKNVSMFDAVRKSMSHFKNLIIEPFDYNDIFKQLIIPPLNSISKTLEYLNNLRVFYSTPFRYYQDFNYTYLISTNGKNIKTKNDGTGSIIFNIKEILEMEANNNGFEIDKRNGSYNVYVSYIDTSVYDNTIINKSRTSIKGITSTGNTTKTLNNTSSYTTSKLLNARLNNDNTNMIDNMASDANSSNIFITINKEGLDADIFTINKKYSINNIDRYINTNGEYILIRKREIYQKDENAFTLNTSLNFRKYES